MKINIINDCHQCRYGDPEDEHDDGYRAWCHEASRVLESDMAIPDWCPLPDYKGEANGNAKD